MSSAEFFFLRKLVAKSSGGSGKNLAAKTTCQKFWRQREKICCENFLPKFLAAATKFFLRKTLAKIFGGSGKRFSAKKSCEKFWRQRQNLFCENFMPKILAKAIKFILRKLQAKNSSESENTFFRKNFLRKLLATARKKLKNIYNEKLLTLYKVKKRYTQKPLGLDATELKSIAPKFIQFAWKSKVLDVYFSSKTST